MANLIIKPSAGGDLVIKGSDASPAITVGATGTTTFAENATLSGTANNLGTVTAGTLSHGTTLQGYVDTSNTGVTFPSGHVLQVKSTVVTDRNSSTLHDTSSTGTDCGLNVTIVPKSNTSDFFLTFSVGICGSPLNNSIGFILSKDGTKIGNGVDVDSRNGIWTKSIRYSIDTNHGFGASATYLDTVSGLGSRVYKVGLISQNTNPVYINRPASGVNDNLVYGSYTSSSLTIFEIQG